MYRLPEPQVSWLHPVLRQLDAPPMAVVQGVMPGVSPSAFVPEEPQLGPSNPMLEV